MASPALQAQLAYEQHVKQQQMQMMQVQQMQAQQMQAQMQMQRAQQMAQPRPPPPPMHQHGGAACAPGCDSFIPPPAATPAVSSAPFVSRLPGSPRGEWPSFIVSQSHPRAPLVVVVKSDNFDPLRVWMPWIEWDGNWLESYPLQTTFRVPAPLLDQSLKVLISRGFHAQQSRLAARM